MPLWEPRRRIELAYQRALERLLKQALFTCRDCSSYAAFKRAMDAWSKTAEFKEFSEALAGKMITGLFADVGRNWREAARYNSKTREMYMRLMKSMAGERGRRVQDMVRENAALIQTLPLSTAEQVSDYAAEQAAKGRRPEDIEAEILKLFPNRTRARSKLIARTEMAKYHTAMIQADCQDLGHNWYFWRCVRDERSRSAHKRMNGILCCWDDPPNPEALFPGYQKPYGRYPPGGTFNCRCTPEPLIVPEQIPATVKVHRGGQITRMNKSAIIEMVGGLV